MEVNWEQKEEYEQRKGCEWGKRGLGVFAFPNDLRLEPRRSAGAMFVDEMKSKE